MLHRHATDERFPAAHAEVDALLQRLGRDVTSLDPGTEAVNTQAISDAMERYETASDQFAKAQSVPELTVVRTIVLEGLQSTRAVRERLGLDPGPDPAPFIAETTQAEEPHKHSWADAAHSGRGLSSLLGAGAAGGLLGLVGGALLGGEMGDMGGGGWGDDGGGWDGGGFGD
jgi:hypothetical protein